MKRLNRPVLTSNLASGAIWLVILAFLTHPVLALMGGAYVVLASLFFAAFYARASYTKAQELLAWLMPWLFTILLWAGVFSQFGDPGDFTRIGAFLMLLCVGLIVGTPCYLAWQALALALRQHVLMKRA